MVIAAYSGTGKTTLAKRFPQTVIDFVYRPYKYVLEPNGNSDEAYKANPNSIMQYEWPCNYVSAMRQIMGSGKHILIPTDLMTLTLLRLERISYSLCYPQRDVKEIYRRRFLDRGNAEDFIGIFIGRWNDFLSAPEQDTFGRHIVLESHQFLSDVFSGAEGF